MIDEEKQVEVTEEKEEVVKEKKELPETVKAQLEAVGFLLTKKFNSSGLLASVITDRAGLSLNSVKSAMRGDGCNLKTLARICDAMGCTIADLFSEEVNSATVDADAVVESTSAIVEETSDVMDTAEVINSLI